MGHPKRLRKKYSAPTHPYQQEKIDKEAKLMENYGLKNKKEIWRAESKIRKYRKRAREALGGEETTEVTETLKKKGILSGKAELDDVLSLKVEDLLERRLQTLVLKEGKANTPKHARQLVVHGHVKVNGQKIDSPGYIVPEGDEKNIEVESNE